MQLKSLLISIFFFITFSNFYWSVCLGQGIHSFCWPSCSHIRIHPSPEQWTSHPLPSGGTELGNLNQVRLNWLIQRDTDIYFKINVGLRLRKRNKRSWILEQLYILNSPLISSAGIAANCVIIFLIPRASSLQPSTFRPFQ